MLQFISSLIKVHINIFEANRKPSNKPENPIGKLNSLKDDGKPEGN